MRPDARREAVLPDGRIGVLFERDNHTKIDLAILPAIK